MIPKDKDTIALLRAAHTILKYGMEVRALLSKRRCLISVVLVVVLVSFSAQALAVGPLYEMSTSAKVILDGRVNAISGMVNDFEKHEEGEIEIAGQKVPRAVFQQRRKDQSIIVNENCLLIDGTNAYLFAFITAKEGFSELRSHFLNILESFEIFKNSSAEYR